MIVIIVIIATIVTITREEIKNQLMTTLQLASQAIRRRHPLNDRVRISNPPINGLVMTVIIAIIVIIVIITREEIMIVIIVITAIIVTITMERGIKHASHLRDHKQHLRNSRRKNQMNGLVMIVIIVTIVTIVIITRMQEIRYHLMYLHRRRHPVNPLNMLQPQRTTRG